MRLFYALFLSFHRARINTSQPGVKQMKIVIVGASGTVGSAVSELLAKDHQVIRVGHRQGTPRSTCAIRLHQGAVRQAGPVRCAGGGQRQRGLQRPHRDDRRAVAGGASEQADGPDQPDPGRHPHLNDKGSITLISGILSEEPINWGRARPPSTAPSITSSRRRPASCRGVCASTW